MSRFLSLLPVVSAATSSSSLLSSSSLILFSMSPARAAVLPCMLHSRRGYSLGGSRSCSGGIWRQHVTCVLNYWFFLSSPFSHQRRCSFNKFDAVGFAGRSRNVANAFNPLELNLFDDPTGGLTAGPAEELSTAEIEHQVRLNVSSYSRSIFYLLYTPFVDVISLVLERGLVPESARPGEVMCRWFTDGALTLQNPTCVEEGMGSAAWKELCEGLDAHYEDIEPVMPLTSAVRKHGLPQDLLVPFLRQVSMDLLVPGRKRAVLEILPGLILGLANGRAPAALGFPTDNQKARAIMVADLFFGAGQETGNTDLAYLGIQLLRANDIPVPFPKQRQLTNVFAAATRIQTDWQMRVSGQLVEVFPKWMDYYKKVHQDNLRMMKKLNEIDAVVALEQERKDGDDNTFHDKNDSKDSFLLQRLVNLKKVSLESAKDTTVTETLEEKVSNDGVHDYFSGNRADNVMRLSDMENHVLQSVRKRNVAWRDDTNKLYYRFGRRRSANEEQKTEDKEITEEISIDDSYGHLDTAEGLHVTEGGAQEEKTGRGRRMKTHMQQKEDDNGVKPKRRLKRKSEINLTAALNNDDGGKNADVHWSL